MSTTRKIAYNYFIQVLGKVFYTGISLVIIILITRYLGVQGYGEYNTVITYLGFFAILADLGLGAIMVREIAQYPEKKEEIIGNTMGLRTLASVIFLALACGVAFLLPYNHEVRFGILVFSFGIFFMLASQILVGVFQINLRMDKSVLSEILGRSLVLILVIIAIRLQYGLTAVLLASAIGLLFQFLISYLFSIKYVKLIPLYDIGQWRKILIESLPLAISIILSMVFFKIDTIFLSVLPLGKVTIAQAAGLNNYQAVGIYGAPYRILEVLVTFPSMFMALIFPIYSKLLIDDPKKSREIFQKAFDFLIIFGLFVGAIVFISAPYIINFIAGSAFDRSVPVLKILIWSITFAFIQGPIAYSLIAAKKQKILIGPYIFFASFNVILNLILIPYFSYFGAACVTVATQLLIILLGYYLLKKHLNLVPKKTVVVKALAGALIIVGIFYLIFKNNWFFDWSNFNNYSLLARAIALLIVIVISAFLYLGVLYATKAVRRHEISKLLKFRSTDEEK